MTYYCRKAHTHGGIVIYTSRTLLSKPLNGVLNFSVEMLAECCGVEINTTEMKIAIIAMYSPPSAEQDLFIVQASDVLSYVSRICPNIVLCGDFNIDGLKTENNKYKLLTDLFQSFGIVDYSQEPTRVFTTKTGTSVSSLDYMTTNIQRRIECTIQEPHISDHHRFQLLQISLQLQNQSTNSKRREVRDFSERALEKFKSSLKNETLIKGDDGEVDEMYDEFLKTLLSLKQCLPKKRHHPKKNTNLTG